MNCGPSHASASETMAARGPSYESRCAWRESLTWEQVQGVEPLPEPTPLAQPVDRPRRAG